MISKGNSVVLSSSLFNADWAWKFFVHVSSSWEEESFSTNLSIKSPTFKLGGPLLNIAMKREAVGPRKKGTRDTFFFGQMNIISIKSY